MAEPMSPLPYPENIDLASQIEFDSAGGKIWLDQQRMTLFSLTALAQLRGELIETIGRERAKGFFIRQGYKMGMADAQIAKQLRKGSKEDGFLAGPQLHALRGMVKVEVIELEIGEDTFHGVIDWIDSYEVEISLQQSEPENEPVCWNLIGYACGYSSMFMERPIFFQEVECVGCGDQRCRIIGKPTENWPNHDEFKKFFAPDSIIEELQQLRSEVDVLRSNIDETATMTEVIGRSKSFRHALNMVTKVSDSKVSVLLLGETGVGKEVMARTLHKYSDRRDQPFVAINCAAIPPDLIESELFGAEKGAFTGATQTRMGKFERAHGGTIFLDEVVELPPRAQATLLRVLQEGEFERLGDNKTRTVDVRLIAATNENLQLAVEEHRFREDLYYRLNAYPVSVPPLRERKEDIPLFIDYFSTKFQALYNKRVLGFSDRAMETLLNHPWPGNIRELKNIIERSVILVEPHRVIGIEHIFPNTNYAPPKRNGASEALTAQAPDPVQTDSDSSAVLASLLDSGVNFDTLESRLIAAALEKASGNVSKAARLVGLSRPAFAYRLKKSKEDKP